MKIISFKLAFFLAILLLSRVMFISAQPSNTSLKVMSYNIWNGFDWGKDEQRKAQWKTWIKDTNPDVLALQELCGYTEEMLKNDAAEWGHPYVALLKTSGYSVGLTSREPIIIEQRVTDDLWHGMLHCKSFGLDFFVVHLSPADCDIRLAEARVITDIIKESASKQFIILGDFNAHSPFDAEALKTKVSLLKKDTKQSESKHSNLRLGQFDYSVMSMFLSLPVIDEGQRFIDVANRFTYPTPALEGSWQSADEIKLNKERIDYILTSPEISKVCTKAHIFNNTSTNMLSDHYPLLIELNF